MSTITQSAPFTAHMPIPFTPEWSRLDGLTIAGNNLTIDPSKFFFRYENPTWLVCDWDAVTRDLLPAVEQADTTIEQMVCDYVKDNGRETTDPTEVLAIAHQVYDFMFRQEQLEDPELDFVPDGALTMLRESGTLMALNRVEMDGHISNASPAWMLCVAMEVVYGLDTDTAKLMDEIYHGTWFNEHRRRESVLAHAALGGRLVHGCQGAPNMSGGVVAPFGCDMKAFRNELSNMRLSWIDATRAS